MDAFTELSLPVGASASLSKRELLDVVAGAVVAATDTGTAEAFVLGAAETTAGAVAARTGATPKPTTSSENRGFLEGVPTVVGEVLAEEAAGLAAAADGALDAVEVATLGTAALLVALTLLEVLFVGAETAETVAMAAGTAESAAAAVFEALGVVLAGVSSTMSTSTISTGTVLVMALVLVAATWIFTGRKYIN